VTSRPHWILAGTIAFVLLSSTAASPQATDATSSASRATTAPSPSPATPAVPAAPVAPATHPRPAARIRIDLYDVAMEPLFILAWVTFAAGFAWRILLFRRLTRPALEASAAVPAAGARGVTARAVSEDMAFLSRGTSGVGVLLFRLRRWVRRTVFADHPVMGAVSLVFHTGLFAVPLLLPAHNILLLRRFGVGLPTLPGPLADKLALGLLALGAFFLLRRILHPRVRALSTIRDYAVVLLVAAPFVTAYMAYHHVLDYRTVLVTHMILGEILIGSIPFTKLGHMPFLILSRFFLSGEYAWRPGNRRW